MTIVRHLVAILVLPVTATTIVPGWIARRYGIGLPTLDTVPALAATALGAVLLAVGLMLFGTSVVRFAVEGRGTLAPWDPPRTLVVRGLYRFVRNPMISGVIFILFGEAVLLRSWRHACWAGIFVVANLVFIPLVEEPQLESRFGEDYRRYKRHVPRFIPRLTPWDASVPRRLAN